jgi:hypothetical protein
MLANALNQVATYWGDTGNTDRYGKPILSAPVQIACRWEDRFTQIVSKVGTQITSKSRVFILGSVTMDGYLALGERTEIDPRPLDGAFEIQQLSETPNLRSLQSLTTVYL